MNFENFKAGKESYKLRFFVGHDGTMIRVASALGFGKLAPLRWPALGSEIVMEVRSRAPATAERYNADLPAMLMAGLGVQGPTFCTRDVGRHPRVVARVGYVGQLYWLVELADPDRPLRYLQLVSLYTSNKPDHRNVSSESPDAVRLLRMVSKSNQENIDLVKWCEQ